MNRLITFLKIKHTSLAAETKLIKAEEYKLKKQTEWLRDHQKMEAANDKLSIRMDLREHRKHVVSFECRCAHLARAFLTGKPYSKVETKGKFWKNNFYSPHQLLNRVVQLVAKYENEEAYGNFGKRRQPADVLKEVKAWMEK
jgi:hypothetical protein